MKNEQLGAALPSTREVREKVYIEFLKFALHMQKEEGRARLQGVTPEQMMIGVSFPFLAQMLAFGMAYGESCDQFDFESATNTLILQNMNDQDPRN